MTQKKYLPTYKWVFVGAWDGENPPTGRGEINFDDCSWWRKEDPE